MEINRPVYDIYWKHFLKKVSLTLTLTSNKYLRWFMVPFLINIFN
jgi:hypothetical protein